MSDPWPPAFMRTAPPTEPGTPTAHSNPVSPASTVRRATTGSAAAPPARTRTRPSGPGASTVTVVKPSPSCRTSPSNPASATSRLDPRPTTSTCGSLPASAAATAASSSPSATSRNQRAAPPTR